jgi:hypothetical protein
MSEVKVNKISPRTNCGTVQLGDSGDTITIPAGATITNNGTAAGFGATGAASWDTTVKTASFTGVAGVGYFVNTTSGAITVTLPASPDAGAVIAVKDYANTFDTNNVTLARNGSNIGGSANDATLSTEGLAVTLVYVDATQGWLVTDDGLQSSAPGPQFITATGGTITCCGDFKIHTFTGPGTFCVSCAGNCAGSNTVDYLVVAGGGGSGGPAGNTNGGGGGGGFRFYATPSCNPQSGPGSPLNGPAAIPVTAQAYPITVGSGGSGGASGCKGSDSSFSTITSTGGGFGANPGGPLGQQGGPGGSGGGGGGGGIDQAGGTGNTPPVSPPQGNNGGNSAQTTPDHASGGGGGAIAVGFAGRTTPSPANSGTGGAGAGITGFGSSNGECSSCVQYFSGGGGGGQASPVPLGGGAGGLGGGKPAGTQPGNNGTDNTGGGGGGGRCAAIPGTGGSGGSGIVVIRYKFQ